MTCSRGTVAVAALLLSAPVQQCWAQAPYPAKLVRIVNPVAPGGNQDVIARTVADQLTRGLGQQVVIESRPASSGIVGTRYVKTAPADGYTLLAISNTFARVPAVMAEPGYDPLKDFAPITLTCRVPMVLDVSPNLPARSIREFIALAKTRPGEITYAASGVGSTGHIAGELFARQAGIKMLAIQYKGNAQSIVEVIGGQVAMMFDQIGTSAPYIKAGKLRPLGITSKKRSQLFPDLPTTDEAGLPGYEDYTINVLLAPVGTPKEILARLHSEVAKIAGAPDLHKRFLDQGIELIASPSPDEFAAYVKTEVARYAKLARDAGIKAD